MPKLTIISVSVDSPEWAELLVKSIRKFTCLNYEIVIVDNGSLSKNLKWLEAQEDVRLEKFAVNKGHGTAMDAGIDIAKGEYVCILDIDSHVQLQGWDMALKQLYEERPNCRLIGCRGPDHKPLKPPLFFFERAFIIKNHISFRHIPNVSTDTAQKAYWDILQLGHEVHRLVPGYKFYDCGGDQFWLSVGHGETKPGIYHHWYGTRFCENNPTRRKDELDGYKIEDYLKNKVRLFEQPLVKEILAWQK